MNIKLAAGAGTFLAVPPGSYVIYRIAIGGHVPRLVYLSAKYESDYGGNDKKSVGYQYGYFLIDPEDDEEGWENYSLLIELRVDTNSLSTEFRKIKDKSQKLKDVCISQYKVQYDTLSGSNSTEADIWKFCSVLTVIPKSISGDEESKKAEYKDKWADKSNNKNYLLSTKEEQNKEVWNHIYKRVLREEQNKKDNKLSSKFKSILSGDDLMKVCDNAYKSTSTTTESEYGKNVREYCALRRTDSWSEYPQE